MLSSFVVLLVPALLVLLVLLVLTGRSEPDPQGERPYAIYLFATTFVALVVAVLAGASASGALARMVLEPEPRALPIASIGSAFRDASAFNDEATADYEPADVGERAAREATLSLFVGVPAVWVAWFHRRRIPQLLAKAGPSTPLVERLRSTFLHAVCFVAVVTAMFAVALAAWGLVRWGWPDMTASAGAIDEGAHGIVQLAANGALALAAIAVARVHWLEAGHGAPTDGGADDDAAPPPADAA